LLAADVVAHPWLTELGIFSIRLNAPGALDAVVDAALARQLTGLALVSRGLSPASAPALARLLGSASLVSLLISGGHDQLLDAAAAVTLGAALRESRSPLCLSLESVLFWHNPGAARELLRALAHRRLSYLRLSSNRAHHAQRAAAGAALGEFVAAAPTLQNFDLSSCNLGDDGLGPLFDALPAHTRLRALTCHDNGLSEAFVRDRVLPAVRASRSLRQLTLQLPWACAREAEALVQNRSN
jgi:hypothetical protein